MSLKDDPSLFAGQILSSVSDMIYILDPVNNHLDFLNSRAADLLYVEPSGPKRGFGFFQTALHEEDRQRRSQHITACLSMPDGRAKEIDVRLRVQAGHYRRFRIRDMVFSRNNDGSVNQLTGIIRLLDTAEPGDGLPTGHPPHHRRTRYHQRIRKSMTCRQSCCSASSPRITWKVCARYIYPWKSSSVPKATCSAMPTRPIYDGPNPWFKN
jgi:hypothetical protein